jgi:sigma-B regulation protein RsbU (phosphoserine phosphatase)
MKKAKSFSRRLSRQVTIFVAIIFVAQLFVVGLTSNKIIADEAAVSTRHILHGTISEIELPLGKIEIATGTVAALISSMPDASYAGTIMSRTVEVDSLICGGSVIFPTAQGPQALMSYEDSSGVIHNYPLTGGWKDDSWVCRALAYVDQYRGPFWAEPYQAEGKRDMRVAAYCYPIYRVSDGDSVLFAVVTTELPVDWMEHKCENMRPYPHSLTTIACGNTIIGLHDSLLIAQIQTAFAEDKSLQELQEDMKRGVDSMRRIGSGSNVGFVVYGPLHNGWMASVVCQYKEVLRRSSLMHTNLLIIGLIVIVLLYIICRFVVQRLTTPITQLSDAALRMAKGDLNTRLPEIKSGDEMMHLHDSFVYMQNSITDYIDELKTTTAANERMESELGVARNIQMGMLRTDFPPNVAALLVPAKEVGGDLYDFVQKGKYLYFTIGDVSGKGVPASLMMAITRAGLRFVAGMEQTMDKLLERINVSVTDTNSNDMFVTLFMGRVNLETRHMEYCNAGHNPIIVVPPDGEPYFLKAKPNLAIGLFDDFVYQAESLDLAAGTRLVLYTDGVNEAERADKSLFGNDRLLAWAASEPVRDPATTDSEVVDSLYKEVQQFTEGNPQNDDITIMSISLK